MPKCCFYAAGATLIGSKNCACVKDGQPCTNCLPSRKGTCLNQSTQSTPTVNQLAVQSRTTPPPSECEGVNERAATGIRLNIEQTAQIPPLLGTSRESAGEPPCTPASECEEMQPSECEEMQPISTYSHDDGDARRQILSIQEAPQNPFPPPDFQCCEKNGDDFCQLVASVYMKWCTADGTSSSYHRKKRAKRS